MMNATTKTFGIGLSLIWVSHLLMDFMLGVWPVYKTIIQLDLVVAGLIASLGIFIGEGLQLYFGYLSDKGYQQKLLALGVGLISTIPFLSYVENEWLLFLMVLCAYVGSGAFHPSGAGIVMTGNSSYQSSLIAFFACGGMVGAAISQVGYSFLHQHFPEQIGFLALLTLGCAIGCAVFPFPRMESKKCVSLKEALKGLKSQKTKLILLYIIHVLLQIIVLSFTFLLPDVLMIKGYEKWFCLGGGYFCFIIGSVITTLPLGYCVDKIGYRLVLVAIVIASPIFLYLFLAADSLSLILPMILLFLLGGTMGAIIPVVVAGGVQDVPPDTRSLVSALYMGGTTCLAGFGPFLASGIASFFGTDGPIIALQGLSFLAIVSLGLIYYLPSVASELQTASQGNK